MMHAAGSSSMVSEIQRLFGPIGNVSSSGELSGDWTIPSFFLKQMLRLSWTGSMTSGMGCRSLCWRVQLDLISSHDKKLWPLQLTKQVSDYNSLKNDVLPSFDKVKVDPLSALCTGNDQGEEWNAYYKNIELSNFIKGDLDRLFLNGIEDGFFQTPERRASVLSILFIWASLNPSISYRQGMHEILGSLLYCVEKELEEWTLDPNPNPLRALFSPLTVEAHTYWLFERVMQELEPIYDPVPTSCHGVENQPFVVQFCVKIQEHYLRILDPALCQHLEVNFVQSQLYGLRWSRLLLGREFCTSPTHLYRLWDFMFASCFDAEHFSSEDLLDDDAPLNVYSVLASVRMAGYHRGSNKEKRALCASSGGVRSSSHSDKSKVGGRGSSSSNNSGDSVGARFSYVCTPLLGTLADFMLAMLLQVY